MVEGNPGGLEPLILHPTDCHRRQDTGYKIQDAGYSIQHTHTSIQEERDTKMQVKKYIGCRMQDRRTPLSLEAPLKRGRRIRKTVYVVR